MATSRKALKVTASPRKKGRPSRTDAEALTNNLLDDALKMFCAVGFDAASIEQLASNANSAKHTIYRRFPNKEALLRTVVEREIARLDAMKSEVYRQHDHAPLATIRKIMKEKFVTVLRPDIVALRRVLVAEASRVSDLIDSYENHLSRDGILPDLITEALRSGELTHRSVADVIELLDALVLANIAIESLTFPLRFSNVKHHPVLFSKRWKLFLSVAAAKQQR